MSWPVWSCEDEGLIKGKRDGWKPRWVGGKRETQEFLEWSNHQLDLAYYELVHPDEERGFVLFAAPVRATADICAIAVQRANEGDMSLLRKLIPKLLPKKEDRRRRNPFERYEVRWRAMEAQAEADRLKKIWAKEFGKQNRPLGQSAREIAARRWGFADDKALHDALLSE